MNQPDEESRQAGRRQAGRRESVLLVWWKWLFYSGLQIVCRLAAVVLFEFRSVGREHTCVEGPALVLSTHQSHLDPLLVGIVFDRHLQSVARKSLFGNRLLATIMRWLNAIELDRERGGLSGMKETMARLAAGHLVLIFPEGTRTPHGRMLPLKAGFLILVRRHHVPLIPMAICGAYEAMPRGASVVRRRPIRVEVGKPITAEELSSLDNVAALAHVEQRLAACDQAARNRLRRR